MYYKILTFLRMVISFFRSDNRNEAIPSIVFKLLKYYKVKVTYTTIKEYISSDPYYPTLKSICNFFEEQSITNYPLRLDEFELYNLDRPYIAHLKSNGGELILVYSIRKERVIFSDSNFGIKIMSKNDFLENWEGIVILIEPQSFIVEPDYQAIRSFEIVKAALVPFFLLILCFAGIKIIIYSNNIFHNMSQIHVIFSLVICHIFGLIFSIFIFNHELNIKTQFTDKL